MSDHTEGANAWRSAVERELKGKASAEQALLTRLLEGVELAALTHQGEWPSEEDPTGFAGAAPFTRGGAAVPRRWDVRQHLAPPTGAELVGALAEAWQDGAETLALRLDTVARAGLDPLGNEAQQGQLGVDGTAIYSLPMLEAALPSDEACAGLARALRLDGGGGFLLAAALHAALLRRRNEGLPGTGASEPDWFAADPLGALARDGRLPISLEAAYDQLATLVHWCRAASGTGQTLVRCLRVSTRPYHDAGATETQDLAAALATGVAYLRALSERGVALEEAAARVSFEVRANTDLFGTLAKLRALRGLWSRLLVACGFAEPPRPRLYAVSSWRAMTQRDPWVNLLRASSAAFAAACAGVDGMSVLPFDATLGEPDRFGRRLARHTQLVLLEEAHLAKVADPAGGAWSLERLTDDLAREAWSSFQQIERRGGMAAVLLDGSWQRDVEAMHQARMTEVATRTEPIVGVSEYPLVAETPLETAKGSEPEAIGEAVQQAWQVAQQQRDESAIGAALAKLPATSAQLCEQAAASFEALIEALLAGAGLHEVAAPLGFAPPGVHTETRLAEPFVARRLAEPYEALRDRADEYAETHEGGRPRVFLVNLGTPAEYTARATFAEAFAQAGGLEVEASSGVLLPTERRNETTPSPEGAAQTTDPDSCLAQFRASGAKLAIFCGREARYVELVPVLAPMLKQAGASWLVLAGQAGENAEAWRAAGLDQTIYQGCDTLSILRQWHAKLGL